MSKKPLSNNWEDSNQILNAMSEGDEADIARNLVGIMKIFETLYPDIKEIAWGFPGEIWLKIVINAIFRFCGCV